MAFSVKNKLGTFDTVVLCFIGLILVYSFVILALAFFQEPSVGAWIWDRHQNLFSWYSRPLFIIPACYYAYKRKLFHVIGFMALMFTSLFWFAAPETVSVSVSEYLEWEKKFFLTADGYGNLLLLIAAVVIFLFGLFFAFWKRNFWYGLLIINLGTVLKIIFSVFYGETAGMAAILPSFFSLLIINLAAFGVWKFSAKNLRNG